MTPIISCATVWINQAGIGHTINKMGRRWNFGKVYICPQMDSSIVSQPRLKDDNFHTTYDDDDDTYVVYSAL